ncbi:MAG: DNA-binding response regulator [Stygiobacter sp. RIFOXYC12_FULL_38_8]|nr:MAG: DNA-binding response regulator [Stygiobacter sp. GWC2_38_9]OGU82661.1 MAG: DNA-binding response regulator [Stygiobacter sp. RIFOXYA12_FULL_38_9]OGV05932.1 MAG: DNA-binding response regulator [Stygiobacter sp. RIFOXYB2_FULL_37_11]OGV14061.1 MAG: DNA-binding response regulator [Stygiobacter sp. RIFOXYA2_FULL_38_8]OGV14523.1 MAG: DNA-binding response regulator [Stygiobacter sp. RIFOXYC2_FULL_38_25]OGV28883.1 MAG: DNA-binding response regulator [Stygiobacter sp. RIFOXYC12_FULL_38_8]RJQ584
MKIVIVDDHELVREGLKKVLLKESGIQLVGEASNALELFKLLEETEVDLVVLDITMPGRSGLDIISEIKNLNDNIRILILSMHPEERFALRALKAGASGYLSKEAAARELVSAIRKIMSGGRYISAALADHLVSNLDKEPGKLPHETLSNREFEIFRLIAKGKSVGQIAEELILSVNTITSYRSRMMEKMTFSSNAEIVRYAIEHNLID